MGRGRVDSLGHSIQLICVIGVDLPDIGSPFKMPHGLDALIGGAIFARVRSNVSRRVILDDEGSMVLARGRSKSILQ